MTIRVYSKIDSDQKSRYADVILFYQSGYSFDFFFTDVVYANEMRKYDIEDEIIQKLMK